MANPAVGRPGRRGSARAARARRAPGRRRRSARATSSGLAVSASAPSRVGHPVRASDPDPAVQDTRRTGLEQPLGPPEPSVGGGEVGEVRLVGDAEPHRALHGAGRRRRRGGTARTPACRERRWPGCRPATTARRRDRGTRRVSRRWPATPRRRHAPPPTDRRRGRLGRRMHRRTSAWFERVHELVGEHRRPQPHDGSGRASRRRDAAAPPHPRGRRARPRRTAGRSLGSR